MTIKNNTIDAIWPQWPQKTLTFRPGNYTRRFYYGFGVVVRDLGEWRPGFYSEFRYASREHSDLPWGAILRNVLVLSWIQRYHAHFSRNKFPKCDLPVCASPSKEHINIIQCHTNRCSEWFVFQYFQDSGSLEWGISSISRFQDAWNGLFYSMFKFQGSQNQIKNNTQF